MNNKYIIDGVEYKKGEEVEVSDNNELWTKGNITGYDKNHNLPIKINNTLNDNWVSSWHYIRKIQPTHCEHESDGNTYLSHPPQYKCKKCGEFYPTLASYTGSSSNMKKFTDEELREHVQKIKKDMAQEKYDTTPSLSGRKATLILDGTEHTVTFE